MSWPADSLAEQRVVVASRWDFRADLVAGWLVLANYSGRDVWPTIAVSLPGYILAGLTPESLASMLVRQASCLDVLAVKTRLTHRLSDNLAVLVSVSERNQPPTDRKHDPLITASTFHQHAADTPALLWVHTHCVVRAH